MAGLALGETRWGEALDWAERGSPGLPRLGPDAPRRGLHRGDLRRPGPAAPPGLRVLADPARDPRRTSKRSGRLAGTSRGPTGPCARRSPRSPRSRKRACGWAGSRGGWARRAEARSALEEVLAREPDGPHGVPRPPLPRPLHEDAGRLDDAARSYEAALALDPRAQSARLALSHVRLRLGSPGVARREVEESVRRRGPATAARPVLAVPLGTVRRRRGAARGPAAGGLLVTALALVLVAAAVPGPAPHLRGRRRERVRRRVRDRRRPARSSASPRPTSS